MKGKKGSKHLAKRKVPMRRADVVLPFPVPRKPPEAACGLAIWLGAPAVS